MKYLQWNDVRNLLQNPLRRGTGWWSKTGHALTAWKSGWWQFTISFSIFLHMGESFHNRNILNNLWWLPILLCMISKTLHGLTLYKPCLLPFSQQLPLLQPRWPCTSLTCCQTYFCHRAFVSAVPAPRQISSQFSSLPKCYLIREVSPWSSYWKETVPILYHSLLSIMSISDIKWSVCLFIVEHKLHEGQASSVLHWILADRTGPGAEWVK